jgi:hypothetical protein
MLRDAAARLFPWLIRTSQNATVAVAVAAPVTPKQRRPVQRHPTLWSVHSRKHQPHQVYCGPTATSALIGADVDLVMSLIQKHRGNDRPVEGTYPEELQHVFRALGYDIPLVANLSANPPSFARWERERTDEDFGQAWLLIVDNHWLAVRGWWVCDSIYTKSVPIRIRTTGPHRRTRVNYVYQSVQVNEHQVVRDYRTGRILRFV